MEGRPVKRISCRKSHVYKVCGCTVWGLRKVPVGSAFSKDMRAGSNAPVPESTGVRVPLLRRMEMLFDAIQKELLLARKLIRDDQASAEAKELAQETYALLNTLVSDITQVAKDALREVTEADVIKAVKLYLGRVEETLGYLDAAAKKGPLSLKQEADRISHERQQVVLQKYCPTPVDEATLNEFIVSMVRSLPEKNMKQMGSVMAKLKEKFSGNYDGTLASKLVKAALA